MSTGYKLSSGFAAIAMATGLLATASIDASANNELGLPPGAQYYPMGEQQTAERIKAQFGVEIQPLRLTAFDNMLDFRYRVLDAEKAKALHHPKIRPFLVDPTKKVRLEIPKTKVGSFRQAKNALPQKDRVYATLFANPGRILKRGETITIVFGDMVLQDMRVQ